MIVISLFVPPTCKKLYSPTFPNVGVQIFFSLASLANHVLSPTFKTVAPPLHAHTVLGKAGSRPRKDAILEDIGMHLI